MLNAEKVCWNITSKCNRNCCYCFKFLEDDLSLNENIEILNRLADNNVKKITWAGGEPYLYNDLVTLLKISKEKGIINYVNTNATLLNISNLEEKIKYVDKIIISLDFIDDKKNMKYGIGQNYYNHISELLKIIKKVNKNIKIQINTVLFSNNFSDIDNIYKDLNKYDIDYWKIIRFLPIRGKSLKAKHKLSISDNQYQNIFNKYNCKKAKFKIKIHGNNEMEKAHIIVLSSGKIVCSENGNDKIIDIIS